MAYVNNTMIIRRDLIAKVAGLLKTGKLAENIDRIPLEISPRRRKSQLRCCIYKERAVAKYKLLPVLGILPEEETDELTTLSEYAVMALARTKPRTEILTVVDEACTACVDTSYIVTNLCRGCVASPCQMNCPRNAISFGNNGQANIDPEKCINCGICKNVCPYHSIVYVPVPCEEACPVGAIHKDENGVEHIDDTKCIYCGKCVNACPFGSIFEVSHMIDIFKAFNNGEQVIALPAPSIMGQFNCETGKLVSALKILGFHDVVEVALGAMETTANEANELKERLDSGQPFMTTSCCSAYVQAVNKHINQLKPFVSHTRSPMHYAAKIARLRYPDARIVFIGPCIAKRKEANDDPDIDFVMTFEELGACLKGFEIAIEECESTQLDPATKESRAFGRAGGVIEAVIAQGIKVDIKAVLIEGLNKKSMSLLKSFCKGKGTGNFVEVMACEGGCIAGPSSYVDPVKGKNQYKSALDVL
jgi:[FeFe] hydrogenase (group B1/B3)